MELPIRFPNEADKLFAEAQACRRMSVPERLQAIGRLTRACRALAGNGQNAETDRRLREERHQRLIEHLQELAKRYGSE